MDLGAGEFYFSSCRHIWGSPQPLETAGVWTCRAWLWKQPRCLLPGGPGGPFRTPGAGWLLRLGPPTHCLDMQPPPLLALNLGLHTCTRSDVGTSSDVQPLPKGPPWLQPHPDLGSPTLHRGRGGNSVVHHSPQPTHSRLKRTARASRQEHSSVHADGQGASSASSS